MYFNRSASYFRRESFSTSYGDGELEVVTQTAASCDLLFSGGGVEKDWMLSMWTKQNVITDQESYLFLSNNLDIAALALSAQEPASSPLIR